MREARARARASGVKIDSGTSVQKKPRETQCVANLRTPKCTSSRSSLVPSGSAERQMSGAARRHSCTGPHVQRCCCLRYAKKLAGSCATTQEACSACTFAWKAGGLAASQMTAPA